MKNTKQDLFTIIKIWPHLNKSEKKATFNQLPRVYAEELFLKLETQEQAELLNTLEHLEKRSWLRFLAIDDVVDLIQQLTKEQREEALNLLDEKNKVEVLALLTYAQDEAGGLMNPRYFRLRPDMKAEEALHYLRAQAKTPVEAIYYAYVLDEQQTLLGVVSFRDILVSTNNQLIKDIMKTNIITIDENLHQEEISVQFTIHHVLALPVIDQKNHMKGIVTVNDIVNVVRQEATQDIQKLGGNEVFDKPYLKIRLFEMIKKRAGWLIVLFISEMFTATAMAYYENEISKAVVLALFIPLIISSGGNSGSQASTLIIRALAIGEARLNDWWIVLKRELISGLALGLILGSVGMLRILLWPTKKHIYSEHYFLVSLTVSTSLVGVVVWGVIIGSMLPFILKFLGFDPASASAPFVATLVDVTGLIIYFSIANLVLNGTLL